MILGSALSFQPLAGVQRKARRFAPMLVARVPMRWKSPEPSWPVLVTRRYLCELAHDSPGHSGHRFFQEIIELSRGRPELKPQDAVRVAEGYAYAYLDLLRDGSLTLAKGLVSSPAMRAELGVTDDASLLSCIAATLYLKPFDPIGSELLDKLPNTLGSLINGTGNNKGKRTSVLKRLSYLLMNRPKLAVFATARLRDMEGRDVQGHGAERIGSVAYSHFAREGLLLTLLALCSGSPSRFLSELEDALDEILTPGLLRAGELLRTLGNDFGVASPALSELLQAVIQPVQVNLDKKVRRKRSGAVQSVLDQSRIRDEHEEQDDDAGSTSPANESDDFDSEPRDTGIDDR